MPVCRSRNELEQEFTQSGFAIIDYWDIWPLLAMLSVANSMTDPPELVKPLQTRRGWSVVYRDTIHRSGSARIVYIKTQSGYTMRLPKALFMAPLVMVPLVMVPLIKVLFIKVLVIIKVRGD